MEISDRRWFEERYRRYKEDVDAYIRNISIADNLPEELRNSSFHLILSGGKRIRPVILMATTELLGGEPSKALPAAAAIELLHNFTLIHDDIMDQDEFRRGVKTTHVLFGESLAILAGDYLFSLVFKLVSNNYGGDLGVKLTKIYSEASEKICIGQAMDINPEKYVRTVDDYFTMVYLKTGALIEAATSAGAVLAGADDDVLRDFSRVGRSMGIAFQIADDLLGIIGDPAKTGKPVGNDIRNGKKTLPILYALGRMSDMDRRRFYEVFGKGVGDYTSAVKLVESYGGIDYARRVMSKYAEEAMSIISKYGSGDAARFLVDLIKFIVTRDR